MGDLIGIDWHCASYERTRKHPHMQKSAYSFFDALLSIRTAHSLVAFLKDYPAQNYFATERALKSSFSRFTEKQILNEAEKCSLVYLDKEGVKELFPGISFKEFVLAEDVVTVEYDTVLFVQERLSNFIKLAAVHYGAISDEVVFNGKCSSRYSYIELPLRTLLDALPRYYSHAEVSDLIQVLFDTAEKYEEWQPIYNEQLLIFACDVGMPQDTKNLYFGIEAKRKKIELEEAKKVLAGLFVAVALTEWVRLLTKQEYISYLPEEGFYRVCEGASALAEELQSIVLEGRVGICSRKDCGRAFIKPRRYPEEKIYCSGSCRSNSCQKANTKSM